jgi:hypothetical protein
MTANSSIEMLRLVNGYQITQAIYVAVQLGVADHLREGSRDSDELARLSGAHPGALYRLLRALAAAGVLHESGERKFSLTPIGDCLRSDSPTPLGPWAAFVGRPYMWQAWGHLLHSIRTGDNAFIDLNGKSVWQYRVEHPEEAMIFDRAMTALSRGTVEAILQTCDFSKDRLAVDIGGGQGRTIAGILTANPSLRGILFDQPHVVAEAAPVLRAAGVENRCKIVGGSFFESIPEGADVYTMRVVLHDWDDEEALAILKTCRRATGRGSRLLIIERVIAAPNQGLMGKLSDLNMLVSPGGRERTRDEFSRLCKAAGFELTNVTAAGPALSVIEALPA